MTIDELIDFYHGLAPESIARFPESYSADAYFKDPFNEVRGVAAIQHIFTHMFVALDSPRFVVTNQMTQGAQCFLTWEFRFAFRNFKKGQEQVILGSTHLVFSNEGLVTLHRDYWDAAQELYEKLPVVSSLMRWLRKRANS